MKMITKVFLVIAILLICLIAWALFLGEGGVIQNTWNGVADSVNSVWRTVIGDTNSTIIPYWKNGDNSIAQGQTNFDNAQGGTDTGTN